MGFDSFFKDGDEFLENGGQVTADVYGMVPGIGEAVEAAQAEFHGQHAVNDLKNGDYGSAAREGAESLWHGASAVPVLHEALEIPHYLELAKDSLDWVTGGDVPLVPQVMNAVGHYAD